MPERLPVDPNPSVSRSPRVVILILLALVGFLLFSQWVGAVQVHAESRHQEEPALTPTLDAKLTATAISITFQKDVRLTDGIIVVTILIVLIILGGTLIGARNTSPLLNRMLNKRRNKKNAPQQERKP